MINIRGKKERLISVLLMIALVIFCIPQNKKAQIVEEIVQEFDEVDGTLEMHVIDVGQADCILIRQGDYTMLVDSGATKTAGEVVEYLQSLGITRIDVLVATHQHHDHIGGMEKIINNFEIGVIYMPNLKYERIDTKSYKSFQTSMENWKEEGENLVFFPEEDGYLTHFPLGQANVKILAPISNRYVIKNNYSIVMRIIFGETSILLAADAEMFSEMEMLNSGANLHSDVIKIGHHGSNSSTTEQFLEAVEPSYAILSVGQNNDYGYPSGQVMKRLEKRDIPVYRTDESGTIIIVTDGESIIFNKPPGDYKSGK